MTKKILLIIILFSFIISCGKKSDPKYSESKIQYINQKKII